MEDSVPSIAVANRLKALRNPRASPVAAAPQAECSENLHKGAESVPTPQQRAESRSSTSGEVPSEMEERESNERTEDEEESVAWDSGCELDNSEVDRSEVADTGEMATAGKSATVRKGEGRSAPSILAIDKASVHRICSGQVVLDMAVAVKELVENAIDAGASEVEVALEQDGLQCIEVRDNGSGIAEKDYQAVTLKHYTSKLRDFSDLDSVGTLGFRGEALSSLCALCQRLLITTRTGDDDDDLAVTLSYDKDGMLTGKTHTTRAIGTTVRVEEIFSSAPVRRQALMKSRKKEYYKLVALVQQYAVSHVDVRFCMTNVTKARQVVLSTTGAADVHTAIVSVFGLKFAKSLKPVSLRSDRFSMTGYVSKGELKCGRKRGDKQFFAINHRPVDLPRVARAFNEAYRQVNPKNKPMLVINFSLSHGTFDVNLTPDKREVLLQDEQAFVAQLKTLLEEEVWSVQSAVFSTQSNGSMGSSFSSGEVSLLRASSAPLPAASSFSASRTLSWVRSSGGGDSEGVEDGESTWKSNSESSTATVKVDSPFSGRTLELATASSFMEKVKAKQRMQREVEEERRLQACSDSGGGEGERREVETEMAKPVVPPLYKSKTREEDSALAAVYNRLSRSHSQEETERDEHTKEETLHVFEVDDGHALVHEVLQEASVHDQPPPAMEVELSLEDLTTKWCAADEKVREARERSAANEAEATNRRLHTDMNHDKVEDIEQELARIFTKSNFGDMQVHGQFNLGFIIAELEGELFILDQHACDEKYNFERLLETTEMKVQALIRPLTLQLTADEEDVILTETETFEKNGFKFRYVEEAAPGSRLQLLTRPFSKATQFGVEEIFELITLLKDAPGVFCRPSRLRSMIASRACRSSIMIGTALGKQEMGRVLKHLSGMRNPWSCPHGRPTMRHLFSLAEEQAFIERGRKEEEEARRRLRKQGNYNA